MEAITTTGELAHLVETVTDGFEHRAECSCGWVSDWLVEDVAAVLAGVEHPELAVEPPDALDGFMSGLLDVQDDLARVVVWMAENWAADLPVPVLPGSGRRPLDLTVQCRDANELAVVAGVLGAELQGDPRYDTDEATYWCARRRFGTVVFEAWRYER
jgi:hypothetical protein